MITLLVRTYISHVASAKESFTELWLPGNPSPTLCVVLLYNLAVESFSQSISRATSLSYTAGTADFDSMNNFAEGKETEDSTNLEQARQAITEANDSLKKAVSLLTELA